MDWLLGALLVFLTVVVLVIALLVSKPKRNGRRCVHCGTRLKVVAGQTTPICQDCAGSNQERRTLSVMGITESGMMRTSRVSYCHNPTSLGTPHIGLTGPPEAVRYSVAFDSPRSSSMSLTRRSLRRSPAPRSSLTAPSLYPKCPERGDLRPS